MAFCAPCLLAALVAFLGPAGSAPRPPDLALLSLAAIPSAGLFSGLAAKSSIIFVAVACAWSPFCNNASPTAWPLALKPCFTNAGFVTPSLTLSIASTTSAASSATCDDTFDVSLMMPRPSPPRSVGPVSSNASLTLVLCFAASDKPSIAFSSLFNCPYNRMLAGILAAPLIPTSASLSGASRGNAISPIVPPITNASGEYLHGKSPDCICSSVKSDCPPVKYTSGISETMSFPNVLPVAVSTSTSFR